MNKQKLLYMFCMAFTINYAIAQKSCSEGRYTNTDYFLKSQIDSLKNISYAKAQDYMGNLQNLKMDVYFPNTDIDTQEKRPLILLIHGGGFTGGARESMSYHSMELSKRGFVVATISYRLGYNREVFGNIQKQFIGPNKMPIQHLGILLVKKKNLKLIRHGSLLGALVLEQ